MSINYVSHATLWVSLPKGMLMSEQPHNPICCRKHWEAATDLHARIWGDSVINPLGMPFIVCGQCGNKRCPKATDCELECTGSNEPGQKGSIYQ